jgi:two-component system sensor kinase FixL
VDPEAFLEAVPLVPVAFELRSGAVTWVGGQAESYFGYDLSRWSEPDFWERVIIPEDLAMVRGARAAVTTSGRKHSIDYGVRHADGRTVWVTEMGSVTTGAHGEPQFIGILVDITDRKLREVALWKSEERLRTLFRNAPDSLVLTDAEGLIINMNEQATALFGYALSDVAGSMIDHLVSDRLRSRFPELRTAFERDPERRSLVDGQGFAIQRRDGVEIPVELSMSLVTGAGDDRQILYAVRDLTARRRVEAQLRSSERRLREVANVLPGMVCLIDPTNRFRFVNEAYARWHGWERRQMEGRLVREILGERVYEELRPSFEAALQGTPSHFQGKVSNSAGQSFPVDVSLVPQQDEDGTVSGYFAVIFDMSDEIAASEADRRHRDELAHVSRVTTMGELAASIAHELNQPLSAIVANAQAARRLLKSEPPALDQVDAALADVASDGRRAGDVIAGMRELLQRRQTRTEPVDMLDLVRGAFELMNSEAHARGVTLSADGSDSTVPSVLGDAVQLKQVLMNLIMNAVEATSRLPSGPRKVEVHTVVAGEEVEVQVRDNGPGLGTDDPEELFQPFVSRREGGLGMGLSISRTIIEAHDGYLAAAANEPAGAVFVIRLPAH